MQALNWLDRINPQVHTAGHAQWVSGRVEGERILHDHELVVFTGGPCLVEIAGKTYCCRDETFLIVPPSNRHSSMALDAPVHRYWVHFDWEYSAARVTVPLWVAPPSRPKKAMLRPAPRFVPRGILHGALIQPARVVAFMQDLALRWKTPDPLARSTCRALLLEVLVLLLCPASGKAPHRHIQLALEAKSILEKTAFTRKSVQDQLASLGYSYEHLCRLFRRYFGIAPVSYVNTVRIARARRLLLDPRLSVAQVAFESGFDDPAYFTRVFRRSVGASPTRYLRELAPQ